MRCDPAPFDTQGGWIDHVVFHSGMTFSAAPALNFAEGAPKTDNWRREAWLVDVLTGDPTRDEVFLGTHINRLRKTYLEQHRRPVAHTPATLTHYLRWMRKVTTEGFHIVHEALDDQVQQALAPPPHGGGSS
jgi:hypothetical protein